MIYLVKYTNTSHTVPGSTKETAYWEIIEEVCQSDSLVDINKYLMRKELPIINSLINFRITGINFVYLSKNKEQLYILDSNHDECLHIMRDYKLKKILNEN